MSVQEFWEDVHKTNNTALLTDSEPRRVYAFHQVRQLANKGGNTVLEIGIGYGKSIRHLARNNAVIAVDIAETALARVEDCAHQTVLTSDLDQVDEDSVDWAISHLVFQHCNDSMLEELIAGVLRALKPDGFFTFQFADIPPGDIAFNAEYKRLIASDVMHFRSPEHIEGIVNKCNGRMISISERIQWPKSFNIGWYAMKIGPNKVDS